MSLVHTLAVRPSRVALARATMSSQSRQESTDITGEDLLAGDGHPVVDVGEQGRLQEESAGQVGGAVAAVQEGRALAPSAA